MYKNRSVGCIIGSMVSLSRSVVSLSDLTVD